jgi:hypothetical protein
MSREQCRPKVGATGRECRQPPTGYLKTTLKVKAVAE